MENAPINPGAVQSTRGHQPTWRTIQEVLGWAVACASVALLSCTAGAVLSSHAEDPSPWLLVCTALGLTSAPGRVAFLAGITVGFTVRSLYRTLLRLGLCGVVLGAVALAVCLPVMTEPHWQSLVLRYGIVGGAAGAIVALANVAKRTRNARL
jgi:hypothetical protein